MVRQDNREEIIERAKEKYEKIQIGIERMKKNSSLLFKKIADLETGFKNRYYLSPDHTIKQKHYENILYNNLRMGIEADFTYFAFSDKYISCLSNPNTLIKVLKNNGIDSLEDESYLVNEFSLPPERSIVTDAISKIIRRKATKNDLDNLVKEINELREFKEKRKEARRILNLEQ